MGSLTAACVSRYRLFCGEFPPSGREVWLIGDKVFHGALRPSAVVLSEYWLGYSLTLAEVDPAAYRAEARMAALNDTEYEPRCSTRSPGRQLAGVLHRWR
jgi:hypothetical protein